MLWNVYTVLHGALMCSYEPLTEDFRVKTCRLGYTTRL